MPTTTSNYSEEPLYLAYRRKSVNHSQKETFHSHLGLELLFIHQGKGVMIVNNTRYDIRSGMFCIFQPCQLHHLQFEYEGEQSFERSMAIFEPTMFEAYFTKWPALHSFYRFIYLGKLSSPCVYDIDDSYALDSVFHSIHAKMPKLSESEKLEEISLFLVILIRTLKEIWEQRIEFAPAHPIRRKTHQVENILNWIEANYMFPYRLDEMAQSLHLSPYHLSHVFKEATGISISEYMATRRIHQSITLLTTSDKPVSLIAEEVGIVNTSYFCRIFKSQMGTTPHQYRKKWTVH